MTHEIRSLQDFPFFARQVADRLASLPKVVVLLEGPMGAGKTTLVREIAKARGSDEASSPSFAIHQTYPIENGSIEHFDLFRLDSIDDLESTGFWDIFRVNAGMIVIEWSERLTEFGLLNQLPVSWPRVRIKIEFVEGADEARRVTLIEGAD